MNYKQLKAKVEPDRRFFTLDTFTRATQIEMLHAIFTAPAFVEFFARIDRIGRGFPLSIVVRWYMAMAVVRENEASNFRRRLECDTGLAALVLGPGQAQLPSCSWLSTTRSRYQAILLSAMRVFYREMIRLLIRSYPDVQHGYIIDTQPIDGHSNPSRRKMAKDWETGRLAATDEVIPATDPDAWHLAKTEHRRSRRPEQEGDGASAPGAGTTRWQWGYQLSLICFIKKRLFPVFDLHAPKASNPRAGGASTAELPVGKRLVKQLFVDYPELELAPDEVGVFIADSAYDDGDFFRLLRDHRLEGVIPVGDDATKTLKGSPVFESHGVELRYRTDYTPVCAQGALRVLPSELGRYPAQLFACPKQLPGQCETECALAVRRDANGYLTRPEVKFRVSGLSEPEELRKHPLFPRRGEQYRELFRLRSLIEGIFSYFRNYTWGCEGDERPKERRLEPMTFRLYIVVLTIGALAMLDDGIELDESVAMAWGLPGLSMREAA